MEHPNFADIYQQYYQSSFWFVKSHIRDDLISEDIVSEALLQLWQTMKKETVTSPQALLITILRNTSLNYLKHENVKQNAIETISTTMKHDLQYRITSLQACEPEELFSTEIIHIVETTLSSLPEQTRTIFEMSRNRHMSVKNIAEELSISPKSVEYHITKSLKALRITLKEYLPLLYFLFNII